MTAAWPALAPALFPYLLLFGLMLLGNGYVLYRLFPRRGGPPTLATATLLLGILVMAAGLWLALIFAILDPGDASVVSVFIAVNSMMGVAGCWAISLFLRGEEKRVRPSTWLWPLSFAVLLVGGELLMGVAFVLGESGAAAYSALGTAGIGRILGDAAGSVWFFGAMFANMLIAIVRVPFSDSERRLLVGFAFSAPVGILVVAAPLDGALAMAILMSIVIGLIVVEVGRRSVSHSFARLGTAVGAGFGAMAFSALASLVLSDPFGKTFVFAVGSLIAMGGEFCLLARYGLDGAARTKGGEPAGILPESSATATALAD